MASWQQSALTNIIVYIHNLRCVAAFECIQRLGKTSEASSSEAQDSNDHSLSSESANATDTR